MNSLQNWLPEIVCFSSGRSVRDWNNRQPSPTDQFYPTPLQPIGPHSLHAVPGHIPTPSLALWRNWTVTSIRLKVLFLKKPSPPTHPFFFFLSLCLREPQKWQSGQHWQWSPNGRCRLLHYELSAHVLKFKMYDTSKGSFYWKQMKLSKVGNVVTECKCPWKKCTSEKKKSMHDCG